MLRLYDRMLVALSWCAAGIVAAIALAISLNVVLRNLGLPTLYGTLELVEYGLLGATFLAAPWVLSRNAHVTIDLLTAALPAPAARALARITALAGCAICVVVAWYGLQAALTSAGRGSMIRTAFVFPEWWVLAVTPAAFALIALEFLRQALFPGDATRRLTGL